MCSRQKLRTSSFWRRKGDNIDEILPKVLWEWLYRCVYVSLE